MRKKIERKREHKKKIFRVKNIRKMGKAPITLQ